MALIQICLDQAKNGAEKMGLKPDQFIFSFDSPLLDYEIFSHLHHMNEHSAADILNQFQKCDQSNRAKDRESVITGPFQVDVIAIQSMGRAEAGRKRKHPGAGANGLRLQTIDFKLNTKAILKSEKEDLCLFRAFNLALKTALLRKEDGKMNYGRFNKYKANERRQEADMRSILEACNIETNRLFYDIEDYGPILQNYLTQRYPDRFKIFAFENGDKPWKPFWKSDVDDFEEAICIFYWIEDQHYEAITKASTLFSEGRKHKYCFACELPFKENLTHRTWCKHKCKNCTRCAPKHPCKEDDFHQFCAGCSKLFKNQNCWEHHIAKDICFKSKRCWECGVVYRTDNQPKTGHKCGEKFCQRCFGFHSRRSCYIRPFKDPKEVEFRYVFYDTESMIDFKPDPNLMKFLHQTNFLWAYVTCSRCVDSGKWNETLDEPCQICGINRLYAWAPFDFDGTEVDVFTKTEDPMGEFVQWLVRFEQNELRWQAGGNYLLDREMGEGYEEEEYENVEKDDQTTKKKKKKLTFSTLVYAHAGSKYDNIFAFSKILEKEQVLPKLIRNGNRLYQMKVKGKDLTTTIFRDSFQLIPIKLAKFVDTFGLDIESKKFFPYHWNKEENYNLTLDGLPPKESYGPGSMGPSEKAEFDKWYTENKNKIKFNLNDQLADYCSNDVKILVHGMVKMRKLFREVTGHDICRSITIPSACMKVFRSYLTPGHLAMTPHMGYELHGSQSVLGRKFLKWYEKLKGVEVICAETPEGEIKYRVDYFTPEGELKYREYKLDGVVERPGQEKDLCIEVNGCYFHACPNCYPDEDKLLAGGIPAKTIRERNSKRIEDIIKEFDIEIYWECEINRMLEKDKIICNQSGGQTEIISMRSFFDNLPDTGLIELHDAFFGGRTGPEAMVTSVKDMPNKVIKYKDFKSLYPFINWSTPYPIKHPELKVFDKDVNWRKSSDMVDEAGNRIEGIIKCFIVPPRHPREGIPVVPMRVNNSLIFGLCRTCAIKCQSQKNKKKRPNYQCPHFKDEERGFSATVNTLELAMALDAGYRVTRVYRCYDWPSPTDWDTELFHEYMRIFMKLKYEAEGWPQYCTEDGISEEEKEERKKAYMAKAEQLYGIKLDPAKIVKNPGLRFIAKLCLNSLWGRFALRNRLSISVLVNNAADMAAYLDNDKIKIHSLEQLDEKNWLLCYKTNNEEVREHDASNLIVALWTTAAARVHLLKHLYKAVEGRLDTKILYMDTDSIIYEFDKESGDPLADKEGDQLGDLADEYPNSTIVEVVSTAPKAYCIWLKDNSTGEDKFVWRMKGIPLTYDVKNKINYERYREMAQKYGEVPEDEVTEVVDIEKNFRIENRREILTVPMKKRLRPVINKGIVQSSERIVPFGWSDPGWCKENNPNDCSCKENIPCNIQ